MGLFYAKSRNVVRYMMDAYGSAAMVALLGAINDGGSIDAALRQAYGIGLDELDRLWSAQLAGETAGPLPVDPRASATTFIIAGAVIITATAIAFRLLKRLTTPSSPG